MPVPRDRHRSVRVLAWVLLAVIGPVLSYACSVILEQERAVSEWVKVPCEVQRSGVKDLAKEKRRLFRTRREWTPDVEYSYTWPDDPAPAKRVSTSVWYASQVHLPSGVMADRIASSYRVGGPCSAWVNPEDPSQSLLVREQWFRPFGWLLLVVGAVLTAAWLLAAEYDWSPNEFSGDSFPPAPADTASEKWYRIGEGEAGSAGWHTLHVHPFLPSMTKLSQLACIPALWHIVGAAVWLRYTALPQAPNGTEQQLMYHAFGLLMLLRFAYAAALAVHVQELEVQINTPKLVMGQKCTLRVRQRRQWLVRNLRYQFVDAYFMLRETRVAHKKRKPQQSNALLHDKLDIIGGLFRVPQDCVGVDARWEFEVPELDLPASTSQQPIYHDWTLGTSMKLQGVPRSGYGASFRVNVAKVPVVSVSAPSPRGKAAEAEPSSDTRRL
eukprot:TRINITY_DN9002_c0_g1_i1.p1 TRINITY_DN9002_c0_g1~~TRINITY_DN9002_c0_g1_i1.p1  ORF type:complete len:462 (+),score=151.96 TRINITY_DN9002_c0_g1_i1:67-1386(+)